MSLRLLKLFAFMLLLSKAAWSEQTHLTLKDGSIVPIEYNFKAKFLHISSSIGHQFSVKLKQSMVNCSNVFGAVLVLFDRDSLFDSHPIHYAVPLSGYQSEAEFFQMLSQENFEKKFRHTGSGSDPNCDACAKLNASSLPNAVFTTSVTWPSQLELNAKDLSANILQ